MLRGFAFGRLGCRAGAVRCGVAGEILWDFNAPQDRISNGFNFPMTRFISLLGMASGFLLISPSFRGTVLGGLGQAILVLGQYSPWSYIALALTLSVFAAKSLAPAKPK